MSRQQLLEQLILGWFENIFHRVIVFRDIHRLDGKELFDDHPLDLNWGWNLVPYLGTGTFSLDRAFASIRDMLTLVRGFDGGAQTYVPNQPFSDLVRMRHMYGYWVHTGAPCVLNYRDQPPPPDQPPVTAKPAEPVVTEDGIIPTPEWMDLIKLSFTWVPVSGLTLTSWYQIKLVENRFNEGGNDNTFHAIGVSGVWKLF